MTPRFLFLACPLYGTKTVLFEPVPRFHLVRPMPLGSLFRNEASYSAGLPLEEAPRCHFDKVPGTINRYETCGAHDAGPDRSETQP